MKASAQIEEILHQFEGRPRPLNDGAVRHLSAGNTLWSSRGLPLEPASLFEPENLELPHRMTVSTAHHQPITIGVMEEVLDAPGTLSRGPSGLDGVPTLSRNVSTMSGLGQFPDGMVSAFPSASFPMGSYSADGGAPFTGMSKSFDQSQFYQPLGYPGGSVDLYLPSMSRDHANFNENEVFGLASSKSVDLAPPMAFGSRSYSYVPSNSVDRMVVAGVPLPPNFAPHPDVRREPEDVPAAATSLHDMTPPHAAFQPLAPARQQDPYLQPHAAFHPAAPTRQQEPSHPKPAEESGGRIKRKRAAPVVVEEQHSTRGAHVKNRPEMQKQARDGQQHWAKMVTRHPEPCSY